MSAPASNAHSTKPSMNGGSSVATHATTATATHAATAAATAATATHVVANATNVVVLPAPNTLLQAAKIAMEQDRAIMLDYFHDTLHGTAFLGEDPHTNERILVKSKDEFTSLIKKLYKIGEDFIILTENSLYIVSGKIQKRKVNLASLQEAYDAQL